LKKIILIYGAVSGAVIIASMLLSFSLDGDGTGSMLVGYLIMLVALSVIFLGIKRHRDQELGGVIRFSTAFLTGLGISLVASVVYVALWEVYLSFTDYVFIHDYARSVIATKEAAGMTGAALQAEVEQMAVMTQQYESFLFRMPMTFLEIFPVGLLVTLVSAGILRNSHKVSID